MAIKSDVESALKKFEKENTAAKGKAYLTSGNRTWESQLDIILQPKRAKNYKNIKSSFLKKFDLKELPSKRSAMTKVQLAWWKTEINKQAGKSPGFPHVGGKAQDVSVKKLSSSEKKSFKKVLDSEKIKVLMEKVTGSTSEYDVSIGNANVFHCYK